MGTLHNLGTINKFYKDYETAGATLNKAVIDTFKAVYEDFGFVPIRIQPTSIRPSKGDKLVLIDKFFLNTDLDLFFEDVDGNIYPVVEIAYRPLNMYLLYQSMAKDIKIK